MQVTVQLAPELQAQLAAEAQARGLALESYIPIKLAESGSRPIAEQRAIEKAVEELRALRKDNILGGLPIKELIEEGRKY